MPKPLKITAQTGAVAKFPLSRFKKFISHLKINSRDYGRIQFKMLGSQEYVIKEVADGINSGITTFVILKGRGSGITTLFIAVDFFYALSHPGLLGTFLIHEDKAVAAFRKTIDLFIDSMPYRVDGKRFRPRIVAHNRNLLLLANDSAFSYLVAGVQESSGRGGIGRSQHTNFVHSTETALYGNEQELEEFRSSVSHLYPYRLQVYESTAQSFNHFYDAVQDAKGSPTVKYIFVGWWRDERNQFHTKDPRFNQFVPNHKLTALERSRVRAVKEQYGFDISLQQIAWARWKLREEFHNDQSTFDQEFPWTDDDAFQATGSKYFEAPTLTQLYRDAKRKPYNGYRYQMTRRWEDTEVIPVRNAIEADLKVWDHASKFGYYVVACDPAYGSSEEADNYCIQAWRCYADGMDQVAEFCTNKLSLWQCTWVIAHLAGFYGRKDCRVIIEINGAGKAVWKELGDLRDSLMRLPPTGDNHELRQILVNMRDYYYKRMDTMSGELAYQLLIHDDIRRTILGRFKIAVELGRMHIRSVHLINEMQRLVNDAGHVAAAGAGNDDRVMTAAMAWHCYAEWLRPMLVGLGHTRAKAMDIDERGGDFPIDQLLRQHLKRHNIAVPT